MKDQGPGGPRASAGPLVGKAVSQDLSLQDSGGSVAAVSQLVGGAGSWGLEFQT